MTYILERLEINLSMQQILRQPDMAVFKTQSSIFNKEIGWIQNGYFENNPNISLLQLHWYMCEWEFWCSIFTVVYTVCVLLYVIASLYMPKSKDHILF